MIVAARELARYGQSLEGATVAVQGLGNVGYYAAKLLEERGCRVIAVTDSSGGCYLGADVDLPKLKAWKDQGMRLMDYPGVEHVTNEDLLAMPCDILVLAALEGQVTADNARNVGARTIVEGANGPITPAADRVLERMGVQVVPDILANAGGVVTSYFEWIQGRQQLFWEQEEVEARLEQVMSRAFDQVVETAQARDVTLRSAALLLAVSRVVHAIELRGLYP